MKKLLALFLILALSLTFASALADQDVDLGFFTVSIPDGIQYQTFPQFTTGTRPLLSAQLDPQEPENAISASFSEGASVQDPEDYVRQSLDSLKATYADGAYGIILDRYEVTASERIILRGGDAWVVTYTQDFHYTEDGSAFRRYACVILQPVSGGVAEITGVAVSQEELAAFCLPILRTIR